MKLLEERNEIPICSFPKEQSVIIVGDILFILHTIFHLQSFKPQSESLNFLKVCNFLHRFTNSSVYFHETWWVGYVATSKLTVLCLVNDRGLVYKWGAGSLEATKL